MTGAYKKIAFQFKIKLIFITPIKFGFVMRNSHYLMVYIVVPVSTVNSTSRYTLAVQY
jgi:hypothetical protein